MRDNCRRDLAGVARYGVILPAHLKMEGADMVSQGCFTSVLPQARGAGGQPEPSDQKAPFVEVSRQVTQNLKCFFCNIFKVSLSCKQLGVFRTNIQ